MSSCFWCTIITAVLPLMDVRGVGKISYIINYSLRIRHRVTTVHGNVIIMIISFYVENVFGGYDRSASVLLEHSSFHSLHLYTSAAETTAISR